MTLKAVFFDLVGTLVRPRGSIGSQYAAMARKHGADAEPGGLQAAFARELTATPPVRSRGGSPEDAAAAEREWWRQLVRRVVDACGITSLRRPDRFDPFFDDLFRHFTTAAAWEVYPDVLPALDRLQGEGLVSGLITNYDTRIYALLASLGLDARLGSVTIPATAGAQKPSPRIFAQALERHRLAPADAAYIGDSPEDDYFGARAAGMRAVLLDRGGEHEGLPGVRRATRLDQAIDLLKGDEQGCPRRKADCP